jgi:hypothetical protein
MATIKQLCALLISQIKQPNAKLPKKVVAHKIQDNDQSIKLGAINEKYHSDLRSKT